MYAQQTYMTPLFGVAFSIPSGVTYLQATMCVSAFWYQIILRGPTGPQISLFAKWPMMIMRFLELFYLPRGPPKHELTYNYVFEDDFYVDFTIPL